MSLRHPVPCSLSISLSRTPISCEYGYPNFTLHPFLSHALPPARPHFVNISKHISCMWVPIFYSIMATRRRHMISIPVPCSLSIFLPRTSISCEYRYPNFINKHTHCRDITCTSSVCNLSLSLSRVPIFNQQDLTYVKNMGSHILQMWLHTEDI